MGQNRQKKKRRPVFFLVSGRNTGLHFRSGSEIICGIIKVLGPIISEDTEPEVAPKNVNEFRFDFIRALALVIFIHNSLKSQFYHLFSRNIE